MEQVTIKLKHGIQAQAANEIRIYRSIYSDGTLEIRGGKFFIVPHGCELFVDGVLLNAGEYEFGANKIINVIFSQEDGYISIVGKDKIEHLGIDKLKVRLSELSNMLMLESFKAVSSTDKINIPMGRIEDIYNLPKIKSIYILGWYNFFGGNIVSLAKLPTLNSIQIISYQSVRGNIEVLLNKFAKEKKEGNLKLNFTSTKVTPFDGFTGDGRSGNISFSDIGWSVA